MRHLTAVVLAIAALAAPARAAAAEPPNPTCVAVCSSPVAEPLPSCPVCEPTNVCSDLARTDRPAYDRCVAEHHACYQDRYDCEQASMAGQRARSTCGASSSDVAACCATQCAPNLVVERLPSAGRWLFVDLLVAGLVRHVPGDYSGQLALGAMVETLFGSTERRGRRVPFRLGPFGSGTLNFDSNEDVAVQFAGGVTALIYGRRKQNTFATAILLSAGVMIDIPPVLDNRVGGLARLSVGGTTTGRNQWKFLSGWLFVEGHYIPGGAEGADRTEVLLGLRMAPFVIPMALIPNAQDH